MGLKWKIKFIMITFVTVIIPVLPAINPLYSKCLYGHANLYLVVSYSTLQLAHLKISLLISVISASPPRPTAYRDDAPVAWRQVFQHGSGLPCQKMLTK